MLLLTQNRTKVNFLYRKKRLKEVRAFVYSCGITLIIKIARNVVTSAATFIEQVV